MDLDHILPEAKLRGGGRREARDSLRPPQAVVEGVINRKTNATFNTTKIAPFVELQEVEHAGNKPLSGTGTA